MKHFKTTEFACKCGCGLLPTLDTMNLAERVREAWGKPLFVSSGMRCKAHTLALRLKGIPAALGSAHIEGKAVDLVPSDLKDLPAFQAFCIKNLTTWNVWMEDPLHTTMWVHLDKRPRPNRIFKP